MIWAAIVGLGWWGRHLVNAVPHSEAIRFTAAHTRTAPPSPISVASAASTGSKTYAAERAGIVLAVGFNRRFHPSMGLLRQAVKKQLLGTIVTISAEQSALHGLALTADAWRARPNESPGGAMTGIGVHLVDGMIDLMGRVDTVYARVASISDRRPFPTALSEVLHGVAVFEAVLRSAASGLTQQVGQSFDVDH